MRLHCKRKAKSSEKTNFHYYSKHKKLIKYHLANYVTKQRDLSFPKKRLRYQHLHCILGLHCVLVREETLVLIRINL